MPFLYSFTIDNEKVEGQIGFSTSRKWEEALDEATLVIPFTYENDTPYKMFSMLNIEIIEIDNYIDRHTIDTRNYEFIVYSDNVNSIGSYGYYKHQVNAIEYTAKLDYYMVNNLSKSRSVLKNTQAPFVTSSIMSGNNGTYFPKVTLEFIDLKEDFYANREIVFNKVEQAYIDIIGTSPELKRVNAVIRTNAPLVSGTSPHTLSIVGTTWVFPKGEWEIEYGFIADGTEEYGFDVGFNVLYTFYVEAFEEHELSMYDVVNEIRTSISKFGGIEDTRYFDSTRIFNLSSEDITYLKSIQAPQIYLSQATARQMLIYALSFINILPRLVNGNETDTLELEKYNIANGDFTIEDVIAYGGHQNTNQIGSRNYQPISQALANNLDDTSIHSPSRSGYQQVRSLDIQIVADNFTIKFPKKAPLYMPKKLMVIIPKIEVYNDESDTYLLTLTDFELDLTPRWINIEEWNLKDITTNFPDIAGRNIWDTELGLRSYKVENLFWKIGDTQIDISKIYGTLFHSNLLDNVVEMAVYEHIMLNSPAPVLPYGTTDHLLSVIITKPTTAHYQDWRFRIEYITDERLVMKQDKEDLAQVSFYSEMRQNQEQALVNIVRQSRKGYGDLQRTGNRTFSFQKKHLKLSEFYEIGQRNTEHFTVTQIDAQWYNDYALATYHIIKYHNRIQQATFVNQKYRPFDNFAKTTLDRHEHYGDYLIALPPNDTNSGVQEQDTKIYNNDRTVRRIVSILLGNDFGMPSKPSATVALVRTDGMLNINPEDSGGNRRFIVSPLTSRGVKGGFVFTLGFKDNQIAGDGLVEESGNYYNDAVRYTDKKGRFTRFGFAILQDLEFDNADYPTYPLIEKNISTFPTIFNNNVYFTCGNYYQNEPFEHPLVWNKDPMTNAQLTYQLNVLSYYVGLYVFGLKFFTDNYIVKEPLETLNGAKLYKYTDGTRYEMFDDLFIKTGYDSVTTLRDNEVSGDGNIEYDYLENTVLFVGISMTNITSWAIGITNDNGDIELLAACNEGLGGIKFVNRHFRPNILEIGNIAPLMEYTILNFSLNLGIDLNYVRGREVPLESDFDLILNNNLTYERGREVLLTSDFGLLFDSNIEYCKSKDLGLDIDFDLALDVDFAYGRSLEIFETLDLSTTLSVDITYTARYTTATPTIHDYVYNDVKDEITYYVRNNDDETAEILSDYSNPPTTDRGDIATTASTSLITLSAPTPGTVYATAQASGKDKSAYTSQYIS